MEEKNKEANVLQEDCEAEQAYDYDPKKEKREYYRVYTITMLMGLVTGGFGLMNGIANLFSLVGVVIGTCVVQAIAVISMILLLALGVLELMSCIFLFKSLKDEDGSKTKKSRLYGLSMLGLSAAYCVYALVTGGFAFMPVAVVVLSLLYLLVAYKVTKPVLLGKGNA